MILYLIIKYRYHVIADPPGKQIGSGGSTLLAIKFLHDRYGLNLEQKKVLLIHSGGYSTRLPHVSVLGKLFMKIPIGNDSRREQNWMELFDLKLIIYIELIKYLKKGTVFLTSSDTIELMSFNAKETSLQNTSLVALAHPSTLHIGSTHGVYKIHDDFNQCQNDMKKQPKDRECLIKLCKEYLHKPSIETMKNHNEIIHLDNNGNEFVYTDSTYFFDYNTIKIILKILDEIQPLTYELEAWSDFLETKFKSRYKTQEMTPLEKAQLTIIKELYSSNNRELNVLVLNNSKFYHMGTMFEYMDVNVNPQFKHELGIVSFNTQEELLNKKSSIKGNICLMNSHVNENIVSFEESVPIILDNVKIYNTSSNIENKKIIIGGWSILSNVELDISTLTSKEIRIPNHTCMFTSRLRKITSSETSSSSSFLDKEEGYVTFIFGTNDDMKANHSFNSLVIYKNILVHKIILSQCIKYIQQEDELKYALWNAPIFPMTKTREQSIKLALLMLNKIEKEENTTQKEESKKEEENHEIIMFVSLKMCVEMMEALIFHN
ncbi:L-fucokinase [Glomus cerebriforme]|uniref:L-fucokinase n=1 Tax=Glomus cerebriforme TaxID=658196 RepID=A0A397SL02_9GLOM|nr:L-fucokinase [Glomus cerebriforme]RIA85316.1 L-fucokinase [Glomus cerebriforme]